MASHRWAANTYVVAVSLAALGVLVWCAVELPTNTVDHLPLFLIFATLYVVAELFPLEGFGRSEAGSFTTSQTFGYALLLSVPLPLALLAIPLGPLFGDLRSRRPPVRAIFNAAQFVLAFGAGGVVLDVLLTSSYFTATDPVGFEIILALISSGITMYVLNIALTGAVIALHHRLRFVDVVVGDFIPFDLLSHFMLLGLAPVFVIATQRSMLLAPLLFATVAAVYRSTQEALRRQHESLHDQLTGLPNRRLFDTRIGETIESLRRSEDRFSLMLIDLDGFKSVNDTLGHHTGDALLTAVADRLRTLPELDTVARLGGDEFGILVTGSSNEDQILQLADELVAVIDEPFTVEGLPVRVGASIGVATFPLHGRDAPTLLRRADAAMYRAKRGRLGFATAAADGPERTPGRVSLLDDLAVALEAGEIDIWLQPKVSVDLTTLMGFEALARWEHPTLGTVPPSDYIAMLENTDLIVPFTEHILERSLMAAAELRRDGLVTPVAVNVSTRDLQDGRFPQRVEGLLERFGLPGQSLELEVTENALVIDPTRATDLLFELRGMGVALSLDDFGTGYSSFAYLSRLPVDLVKVDRSFVRGMCDSTIDAHIVQSIIDLASGLGLHVVAEGVENEDQRRLLATYGCQQIQGYLVARPMTVAQALAWQERFVGQPAVPAPRPTRRLRAVPAVLEAGA